MKRDQSAYQKRWYAALTSRQKTLRHLKCKLSIYKMSLADYVRLEKQQRGLCAICQKRERLRSKQAGKRKALNIDHDHKSGTVRGLLCWACNSSIGKFDESPDRLRRAAAYLERGAN